MSQFLIGVDEAGRGPLAGPVAVGAVALHKDFAIRELFPGVADSKLLSPKKREEIFEQVQQFQKQGALRYIVVFSSAKMIDKVGISKAVRAAVYKGVRTLAPEPEGFVVLLDGLLRAPDEYEQETIVRGDQTEPIISLASIMAKVTRDRAMVRLSAQFPKYQFDVHKGYGTAVHRAAIKKWGLCDVHRKTWQTS